MVVGVEVGAVFTVRSTFIEFESIPSVIEKMTGKVPTCETLGVHENNPVELFKVAPKGKFWPLNVRMSPKSGSNPVKVKVIMFPAVAIVEEVSGANSTGVEFMGVAARALLPDMIIKVKTIIAPNNIRFVFFIFL